MTDTKEIASLKEEIATLKADVAALRQRHDEEATMKQQIAALAQQVSKLMAFAAQNAARTGVASPVDEQAILLAARANERARQLTPPVRFGSSTPYDGQSDRIDGKRREALGK
jgi:cell division septum initiation protein DivIVA